MSRPKTNSITHLVKEAHTTPLERQQVEDVRYIERGDWSAWPWCPLTRKNESAPMGQQYGLIHVSDPQRVVLANLFGPKPMSKEELYKWKGYDYSSVTELIRDGWCVD